jgi:hypothetical protein
MTGGTNPPLRFALAPFVVVVKSLTRIELILTDGPAPVAADEGGGNMVQLGDPQFRTQIQQALRAFHIGRPGIAAQGTSQGDIGRGMKNAATVLGDPTSVGRL